MGSEDRQILEKEVDELEEKVEEWVRTQKDVFLVICQRMISVLTEHLSTCDQEGVDYETTWFLSTVDNFRQLLVQVGWEEPKVCLPSPVLHFTFRPLWKSGSQYASLPELAPEMRQPHT